MTHHLLGSAEVAQLLGVSRQRLGQLALTTDFPEPEIELAAGRIWSREAIETWVASHPERRSGPRVTCSFCGKAEVDAGRLVSGPGVYICNECVERAGAILGLNEGSVARAVEVGDHPQIPLEIEPMLDALDANERTVLVSRFGLDLGRPRTIAEVGNQLDISDEEVARVERSALEKLRTRR